MKICIVQTRPLRGEIGENIERHVTLIERAASKGAEVVIFPELSLTGYEPALAEGLAMDEDDERLDVFQGISDERKVVIGVGAPTRSEEGLNISLILFRPGQHRRVYSKTYLHPDEEPFFMSGTNFPSFIANGVNLAIAICYELSVPEHAADAVESGADFYIASVAKHADGVAKANERLAEIARTFKIPCLMANSVGPADNFVCAGGTAVWNARGERVAQLDGDQEGIIVFNTETGETVQEMSKEKRARVAG